MHENTNASLEKNKLIVARSNRYTFLPFKSEAKYGVHYFILHWAGQKEINDEFFIRHKQPWLHPSRLGISVILLFFFLFINIRQSQLPFFEIIILITFGHFYFLKRFKELEFWNSIMTRAELLQVCRYFFLHPFIFTRNFITKKVGNQRN